VEFPDGTPAPGTLPKPGGGVGAETIVVAAIYSLMMAASGGLVFYVSVRRISTPVDMGSAVPASSFFLAALAAAALLALNVMWLAVPAALLVLGLVHLRQSARLTWRPTVAWIGAVASSVAIGWLNIYFFNHWDGYGGPYWRALVAAIGQLAAGAAMIALIAASARRPAPTTGRSGG
jgi:hypothetical protein